MHLFGNRNEKISSHCNNYNVQTEQKQCNYVKIKLDIYIKESFYTQELHLKLAIVKKSLQCDWKHIANKNKLFMHLFMFFVGIIIKISVSWHLLQLYGFLSSCPVEKYFKWALKR